MILFGPITMKSRYLVLSQKRIKERLLNIKKVGHEFLQRQKVKHSKGEKVAPFVQAYLDLND
jgi:hypothetical protein